MSKLLLAPAIILAVVLAGLYGLYRFYYPYGMKHCCILIVSQGLESYAENHNGEYPSGKATPEASLSLLFQGDYANAYLLSGKTASESTAERILKSGGLLGPESCSWHYVEGLSTNDDSRIAILWDKIGLGHDGQRLKEGGHEVIFVRGGREFVMGKDWDNFLKGQQDLLAARHHATDGGKSVLIGQFYFAEGNPEPQSSYGAKFTLYAKALPNYNKDKYVYSTQPRLDTNSGYTILRSGDTLLPSALTWYRTDVPTNGVIEYTLTFPGFRSWPVVVEFTNGVPSQSVLFQMSRE